MILACGPRRCCAPSDASRAIATFARNSRSRRRLRAASAAVGAASFRLRATRRKRRVFRPRSDGGSDVVYARVCKEGPVFFNDELRW